MEQNKAIKSLLFILISLIIITALPDIVSAQTVNTWSFIGPVAATDTLYSLAMNRADTSSMTIFAAGLDSSVYRSMDNGATWSKINFGVGTSNVIKVLIHASDTNTVYAATDTAGVFVSSNYGAAWTSRGLHGDTVITDLVYNYSGPDTLFAVTNYGLFRSLNRGNTWSESSTGLNADALYLTKIVQSTSDSTKYYLATSTGRIYRSTNSGASWSVYGTVPGVDNITSIIVDNTDNNILYVGVNDTLTTDGVYKTTNGSAWSKIPNDPLVSGRMSVLSLALDTTSTSRKLYAGTMSKGVFRFNISTSLTWSAIRTGLTSGQINDILIHPDSTHVLFAATTGNGIQRYNSNREPVITVKDTSFTTVTDTSFTISEDSMLSFYILATDDDGDPLSFTTSVLPTGATYTEASTDTFQFIWTPDFDQAGSYEIDFNVLDDNNGITTKTIQITVTNKNQAPYFDPILSNQTVNEGNTLAFTVYGRDDDNDQITYGTNGALPTGAGFDSTDTKRFSWIPTYDDSGSYNISFRMDDGQGGTTIDSITITVVNVNRAPVFSTLSDTVTLNEGELLQITVSAADADNDSVYYNAANLPTGATFGTISGAFSWIPNFTQSGTYRIVFNALDTNGGASFEDVVIIVNDYATPPGYDNPPTIIPVQDYTVSENDTIIFQLVATDDGPLDSLTYGLTASSLPAGAKFDSLDTRIFEWATTYDDSGTYNLVFTVIDSFPNTSTEIVVIRVNNVNRVPETIMPSDTTFSEGETISMPLGIADPDSDSVTVLFLSVPSGASIDSSSGYTLNWTPTYLQADSFLLRFRVDDGNGGKIDFQMDIIIENTNRAPASFNILYPTAGQEVKLDEYLMWEKPRDPDIDDSLSYRIEIDDDSSFSSIDIIIDTLNNNKVTVDTTSAKINSGGSNLLDLLSKSANANSDAFVLKLDTLVIPQLLELSDDSVYYWRVEAFDGNGGVSDYTSGYNTFHINLENDPPLSPGDGFSPNTSASVKVAQPTIKWDASTDQDYSDTPDKIKYIVEIADNMFYGPDYTYYTEYGQDSLASPISFGEGQWEYRLKAIDNEPDTSTAYSETQLFVVNIVNEPPNSFNLVNPADSDSVEQDTVFFDWDVCTDPDEATEIFIKYRLEIATDDQFTSESIIMYKENITYNTSHYSAAVNVLDDGEYYWRVIAEDDWGATSTSETRSFRIGLVTGIHDPGYSGIVPTKFMLENNYPNPFNNHTFVRFGLPKLSEVKVRIYSVTGKLVYSEDHRNLPAGYHIFKWNGRSNSGYVISSGVYFLVISDGRLLKSQKITLIK